MSSNFCALHQKFWKAERAAEIKLKRASKRKSKEKANISLAWQAGVYAKRQLYRVALLSYRKLFNYIS